MVRNMDGKRKIATEAEYAQVFNRLCHMVVLSQEGKVKETVDDLIVTALALEESQPKATSDVINRVYEMFKLSLSDTLVQPSLDRLLSKRLVIQDSDVLPKQHSF
jgi:hypothetical protein